MDEAGNLAQAAALATAVMGTAIAVRLAYIGLNRFVFDRMQIWRRR